MKRIGAFVIAMHLMVSGCTSIDRNLVALPDAPPSAYRLGPGDEVRVAVFGLDAMTNTYIVGDTGMIALPLLDPVAVSGKTVREVETAIAASIADRRLVNEPRVSAQVQAYRPFFITGEVQRPGQYPYVPGMSLLTAVSVAGGYTFRANTKSAVVRRQSTRGIAKADTPLMPGDIVEVRESSF